MKNIDFNEISFDNFSVADDVGRVFHYQNEIYRAINSNKVKAINEMFDCGLLKELMDKNMIPKTEATEYKLDGFSLVLKHEKVDNISYISEWTFDMVKDAAILVLEISKILLKYGYVLKDCHPYNILFNKGNPVYVDIGSFIKSKVAVFPEKEFIIFYYFILKLMKNDNKLTRNIIKSSIYPTIRELCKYKYGLNNNFLPRLIDFKYRIKFKLISIFLKKESLHNLINKFIIKQYFDKICNINSNKSSVWADYHDGVINDKAEISSSSERFRKIIELIKTFEIKNIVEIAGNSGAMSIMLSDVNMINKIICTDYDEWAINNLYNLIKLNGEKKRNLYKIYPMALDFTEMHSHIHMKSFGDRFKADLVIAMAVTHHLLLTQCINIDVMFNKLSKYTSKYILIEFMPLGLWGGGDIIPVIPDWYNVDWFRENMSKNFKIIYEEKVEKNRIVFWGEKLNS